MNPIVFPGLGLEINIDPVAVTIFGLSIYWYGIIIACGFLVGIIIATYESKRSQLNSDIIVDVVLIGTPSAIIGARLYYVFFNWSYYKNNLSEVFSIRSGGLAIYGAIIAALISTVIYCKIKKINVWKVFDVCAPGLIIAQSIGRWGNFVNREAYGRETTLPWRMEIFDAASQSRIAVHPTFLYESLWNLVGFLIIMFCRKKKKVDGEVFLLYAFWYGLGRAWIEGLRTDSLYFGSFRISQVLAILSVLVAGGILAFLRKNSAEEK